MIATITIPTGAKSKLFKAMSTKEKLLALADFLENQVKDHWFDLRYWATTGFTEQECGTTACAAGWATVCFPDSGLSLTHHMAGINITMKYVSNGRTDFGSGAVQQFFGIGDELASHLFYHHHYRYGQQNKSSHLFYHHHYRYGQQNKRHVVERLREVANRTDINVPGS